MIFRYDQENIRLKEKAVEAADQEDLNKRQAQDRLMEKIAERVVKVKMLKNTEDYSYERRAII
jgi:hypothetical protein